MSFFCLTDKTFLGTMVFGRTAVLALGLDFVAFAVLALGLGFATCSGGTYLLGDARVLFISNIPSQNNLVKDTMSPYINES
jgi:hypothetical protein